MTDIPEERTVEPNHAPGSEGDLVAETLLTTYVDRALGNTGYTESAVAAAASEVNTYLQDLRSSAIRRQRDDRSEVVIQRHVEEAAKELRDKQTKRGIQIAADWSKRLGFLFIGLSIQQLNIVRDQDPIVDGSVTWLVVLIAAATALTVAGFVLDISQGRLRRQ